MINNKILPAHILRLYTWEVLKQETAMTKINEYIPILPIEDELRVSDEKKTYAIYGYSENNEHDIIHQGVFSLRVVAQTFAELGQVLNVVALAFESTDVATEAVNNFTSTFGNGTLLGLRFTRIKASYVEGGEASESEGGPVDGVVNVSYEYITNLPIPIPDAARGGLWS